MREAMAELQKVQQALSNVERQARLDSLQSQLGVVSGVAVRSPDASDGLPKWRCSAGNSMSCICARLPEPEPDTPRHADELLKRLSNERRRLAGFPTAYLSVLGSHSTISGQSSSSPRQKIWITMNCAIPL